jgi:hypothetical protein
VAPVRDARTLAVLGRNWLYVFVKEDVVEDDIGATHFH